MDKFCFCFLRPEAKKVWFPNHPCSGRQGLVSAVHLSFMGREGRMDRWMMGGGGMVRSYLDQEGGGRVPLKPNQDQGGLAPLFLFFFFSASCGHHEDLCHNTQTPERLRAAAAATATAAGRRKKKTKTNKHSGQEAEQTNVEYYFFLFICLDYFFSCDISGGACACRSKSMPASLCRFVKRGDAPRSPRNN